VGRRGGAHEVDRPVGELAGEVPFAVHLAAGLVHRADAVHGLVLLPQPLARLTRVQQVVEPAGAGGGEPVEGGVEAVLLGAGAVAGPLGAVVDLAEVAGAVAVRTQQLGQHRLGGGREGGVVEPVPAPALLVGAGDEPRAGGGADRGGDVGAVEPRPALGEPVEVRGAGVRAAARGEIAVAVVVRDDQQDVGAGGRGGRHAVLRGGCTGPSTPTAPSSVGGRGGAWWPRHCGTSSLRWEAVRSCARAPMWSTAIRTELS